MENVFGKELHFGLGTLGAYLLQMLDYINSLKFLDIVPSFVQFTL